MSISGRNAPLSPISVGGSDYSSPKHDERRIPNGRGNLVSPPLSVGSPAAIMSMNGFPTAPRSINGAPSPPPSIGRSSVGTNGAPRSDSARNSTRVTEIDEAVLSEHYIALRAFLQARDPNAGRPPNKARDKLLRLSSVQFYELSTDVFDELMRRQASVRAPPNAPNAPPTYLLPEKTFHPKRNQARQRLSSLGPPRFRDLAADVFHELERRFPRFLGGDIPRIGSGMSSRGPSSRGGTPVNGGGHPPRGPSRIRRPSDASSIRGPPPPDAYGGSPSPGLPSGDFGRPVPKQLNQNNTIVPNKSIMLEEDDGGADDDAGDAFGLENIARNRDSKRSAGSGTSGVDKKIIDDYQLQVGTLQQKLEAMEGTLKKKSEELNSILDNERSRVSSANVERQEWNSTRTTLEDKLAEAQNLNDSMKQELERLRMDHGHETQQLRDQMEDLQQDSIIANARGADPGLEQENEGLRRSLAEQQRTTELVRSEAQEFLQEMRSLSQQGSATYEKQLYLEQTVEQLEQEVRDWRNRYSRTKTQLRNMRASSVGLQLEQNAEKYLRDKGFTDHDGMIRDIHVTKFQIAVDELLLTARKDDPEKVTDAMKLVVVAVRRITKDVDEHNTQDQELLNQQAKLKTNVSSTANNLITASKAFASGAGISPVSLLDAAASHLSAAVIDMLKVVKIHGTPAEQLDEDVDGSLTPVDVPGRFSYTAAVQNDSDSENFAPPPSFRGLGGVRASATSSAYSPISSPRESIDPRSRGITNGVGNATGYQGMGKSLPPNPPEEYRQQLQNGMAPELKMFLDDQTAVLMSGIQNLITSVREEADSRHVVHEVESISGVVSKVVYEMQTSDYDNEVQRLEQCGAQLQEATRRGQELIREGRGTGSDSWRAWTQVLPPIVMEIARETRELVQRLQQGGSAGRPDDEFS